MRVFSPIYRSCVAIVLSLSFLAASGCNPNDEPQPLDDQHLTPYGEPTALLPDGATEISFEDFSQLEAAGQLRTIVMGEEPNTLPAAATAETPPMLTYTDKNGEVHQVPGLGAAVEKAIKEDAARSFPSRANQIALYRSLRKAVSGVASYQQDLPSDDAALDNMTTETFRVLNDEMSGYWQAISVINKGIPAPATGNLNSGLSAECALEEGFGAGTDRYGATDSCAAYSATGLQRNFTYPGKQYATCVKNQASRGTCVAFANTSTFESAIAQKHGKTVNLSEQDMYFRDKAYWPNSPALYGDGTWPSSIFQNMIDSSYKQPFESSWDYNPARYRGENDTYAAYTNSCKNYPGTCSDTAGQGGLVCAASDIFLYCGYLSPAPSAGAGYRVKAFAELWNENDKTGSLNRVRTVLATGTPLVLAFSVTSDWDYANSNGYITFTPNVTQTSRGGHAVHITGFITNEELATASPGAPAGAGGGYLIIKNSWGNCWADGGYVYAPFDWFKKYAWAVTALTEIN